MRSLLVTLIAIVLSIGSLILLPAGSCSPNMGLGIVRAPECRAEAFATPAIADLDLDVTLPMEFLAILIITVVTFVVTKTRADANLPVAIRHWIRFTHPLLPKRSPIPIETFQPTLFATRDH